MNAVNRQQTTDNGPLTCLQIHPYFIKNKKMYAFHTYTADNVSHSNIQVCFEQLSALIRVVRYDLTLSSLAETADANI